MQIVGFPMRRLIYEFSYSMNPIFVSLNKKEYRLETVNTNTCRLPYLNNQMIKYNTQKNQTVSVKYITLIVADNIQWRLRSLNDEISAVSYIVRP